MLSFEESRRLAELERDLAAEDPRLARILSDGPSDRSSLGPPPGAVRRAILTAVAGVVVFTLGITSELAVFTVGGYLLIYAAVLRFFFLCCLGDDSCP